MTKQIVTIALIGSALFSITACNNKGGFKTTPKGLEYNIVKDVPGDKKPKIGDFVEMNINVHVVDGHAIDSEVFNSRKMNNGMPITAQMQPEQANGDPVLEGLMLLTPGDSAIFRSSVDSMIKKGAQLPPWMKKGMKLEYRVALLSIKSKDQMQKEADQKSAAQKDIDEKILQEYFTKNNITASKTPSGVYYTIQAPGTGELAKPGQAVTVFYTGKTLDGKVFDSNQDPAGKHTDPFKFTLGQHQVIQGWDDGVSMLKKGSKATLYIPSTLAYGDKSPTPAIPANSILMFNIDVTDVK